MAFSRSAMRAKREVCRGWWRSQYPKIGIPAGENDHGPYRGDGCRGPDGGSGTAANVFCGPAEHFCVDAEGFCIARGDFCVDAEPFCIDAKHFCIDAEPFCVDAEHFCIDAEH
ncbi:MAG: hypothetical protein ACK462_13125, partial [Planctomyces sp.]